MRKNTVRITIAACAVMFMLTSVVNAQVTATTLTSGGTDNQQSNYTTASITPSANKLILLQINERYAPRDIGWGGPSFGGSDFRSSSYQTDNIWTNGGELFLMQVTQYGATGDIPSVTWNGRSWVQVNTVSNNGYRITLFRAWALPYNAPADITFSGSGPDRIAWSYARFSNTDSSGTEGSGSIVQSSTASTASGTEITLTLSAFSFPGDAPVFFTAATNSINGDSAWSQSSGSQIGSGSGQINAVTGIRCDNDLSTTLSWSAGTGLGIMVELKRREAVPWPVISISGNSLTWVPVDTVMAAWGKLSTRLYRAMGSSPATGAISISYSTASTPSSYIPYRVSWSVVEFNNVDQSGTNGSGAIVQKGHNSTGSGANGASSLTVNLAPFANANNAAYGGFCILGDQNSTVSPGSGFHELTNNQTGTNWDGLHSLTEWVESEDQTVDESGNWSEIVGIAVEIKYVIAPVPVQLTSFSAVVDNGIVTLHWRTATEINNFGFDVERSLDGGNWSQIDFVPGHGTANTPHQYSATDQVPMHGDRAFYRLTQIDRDGSATSYKPIEVQNKDQLLPTPRILEAYPNPANPSTQIRFALPNEMNVSMAIIDMLGREVVTILPDQYRAGGVHTIGLNLGQIPSGMYTLLLRTSGSVSMHRLIIER